MNPVWSFQNLWVLECGWESARECWLVAELWRRFDVDSRGAAGLPRGARPVSTDRVFAR